MTMDAKRKLCLGLGAILWSAACGGGSGPGPTDPPVPTYSVAATVFYDENGNGQLDAREAVRVPGVDVVIGSGSGRSAPGTGIAQVTGIREGSYPVDVRTDSLPAFFQPLPAGTVQVPGGATEVRIALTLPIGANNANVYLGMGDSITGVRDNDQWGRKLQGLLAPHFGRAEVVTWGRSGATSWDGAPRTRETLRWYSPAYVLVLYGTNDWQDQVCQSQGPAACRTIDALRDIVEQAQEWDTLPVLATILPVNPSTAPEGRNRWIDDMNGRIKALGASMQIPVADLNADFKAAPSVSALYLDDVHPNDSGNQLIAQGWFKAITRSRSSASSSSPYALFRR